MAKIFVWKMVIIRDVIMISRKGGTLHVVSNACSDFPGEIQGKLFIFSMGFLIHQWGESFYLYICLAFTLFCY